MDVFFYSKKSKSFHGTFHLLQVPKSVIKLKTKTMITEEELNEILEKSAIKELSVMLDMTQDLIPSGVSLKNLVDINIDLDSKAMIGGLLLLEKKLLEVIESKTTNN